MHLLPAHISALLFISPLALKVEAQRGPRILLEQDRKIYSFWVLALSRCLVVSWSSLGIWRLQSVSTMLCPVSHNLSLPY